MEEDTDQGMVDLHDAPVAQERLVAPLVLVGDCAQNQPPLMNAQRAIHFKFDHVIEAFAIHKYAFQEPGRSAKKATSRVDTDLKLH